MVDFSPLISVLAGEVIIESEKKLDYAEEINAVMNAAVRCKKPTAFVKVATKEDVINTVKFCVENKLDLCVSSGGKNSDFALADEAVALDLSPLNQVVVNVDNKTAIVGGGAKHRDMDKETVRHGMATSLGVYSDLGVAGVTLLGGNGFLSRWLGLGCDNVLEYELVTATGEIVKASEKENPDLLWGMKGYGFNFGVVTSLTFQLYDIPELVIWGILSFPLSQAKAAMIATRNFLREKADNKFAVEFLPNFLQDGPGLRCRVMFSGLPEEGEKLISELCERTKPLKKQVELLPYDEFQKIEDWRCQRGLYYYSTAGRFLQELTDDAVSIIMDAVANVSLQEHMVNSCIYMISFGGKIRDIPHENSAYPFRQAEYFVGVKGATHDAKFLNTAKEWVDTTEQELSKYAVPFTDKTSQVWQKLKKLKRQYDPNNVFCHNVNIDPEN